MIFGGFPISNYNPDDITTKDPFTENFLQTKLATTDQHIKNLSILDDAQDQFNVLRIGIIPEFTYLYPFIHMGENAKFQKYAKLHEHSIQKSLSTIINTLLLTPERWAISKLPIPMAGPGLSCAPLNADISFWSNSSQNTESNPSDQRTALALTNLRQSPKMDQLISKIQAGSSQRQLQKRLSLIAHEDNLNIIMDSSDLTQ